MSFDPGVDGLIAELKGLDKRYRRAAIQVMNELVEEGAELTRANLYGAETTRGMRERDAGRRSSAGRDDTGRMVGTVTSNSGNIELKDGRIEGSFGWFAPDFEEYMKWQEEGGTPPSSVDGGRGSLEGIDIPPAHSLFNAFIPIREKFKNEMSKMIRKGGLGSSR